MTKFSDSATCNSHAHCKTCRDRQGGRKWRENLAAAFELPADAPDFECPAGIAWDETTPSPIVEWKDPAVEEVETVRMICQACSRQDCTWKHLRQCEQAATTLIPFCRYRVGLNSSMLSAI